MIVHRDAASSLRLPARYDAWFRELLRVGPAISDRQMEACANLATVLLCGEQSAIRIFAAEVERSRQRGAHAALRDLLEIERDEHLHERALLAFCRYLPATADQHTLKRRAQRFFARLGRTRDLSAHFAQISELDRAVCKIMWHVENSGLDRVSPLRELAGMIKMDEARHVAVSRRYAAEMGYEQRDRHEFEGRIRNDLVTMLRPLGASFEVVGVDSDRLFRQIVRSSRS